MAKRVEATGRDGRVWSAELVDDGRVTIRQGDKTMGGGTWHTGGRIYEDKHEPTIPNFVFARLESELLEA